jgi:lipid-A-disaccharide synthase
MQQQGVDIVKHYKELAFMGFIEVIQNLDTILKNVKLCKAQIEAFQPDTIIFIDYPGFNLRIAKWAKEHQYKTCYYISPKIWAWKQSRAYKIRKYIDKMFVIFPFEVDFYKKFDYEVEFVGHPLMDAVADFTEEQTSFAQFAQENNLNPDKKIVAILPGSRTNEIKHMLPNMLKTAENFPDYQFVIAGAPSQNLSLYQDVANSKNLQIVFGKTYELLHHSYAGLITSGTATLETALFNVPQVVCYKGNQVSYLIARQLVKVKYISLVNLVLDYESVKEYIQHEMNVEMLTAELDRLLHNTEYRTNMLNDYVKLHAALGNTGASNRTAEKIVGFLK